MRYQLRHSPLPPRKLHEPTLPPRPGSPSVAAVQPADIGRLVGVAAPRLSPDGRQVAFVVSQVELEGNRYRSAVWPAATKGGRAIAVTAPRGKDRDLDLDLIDDVHLVPAGGSAEPPALTDHGPSHTRPEHFTVPSPAGDGDVDT